MPPDRDPLWLGTLLALGEIEWIMNRRPYYAIYPAVLGPALRMTLEVTPGQAELPVPSILLKLPKTNHGLSWEDATAKHYVQIVMVSRRNDFISVAFYCDADRNKHGGSWAFPIQPKPEDGWDTNATFATLIKNPKKLFERVPDGEVPQSIYEQVMRLVAFVCLIDPTDPDLVSPDLLNKDLEKAKHRPEDMETFIARAHRMGKWWSIGRGMEISPPYRRAYFELRWTGEGRSIPKIVPVRGAWIHRDRLTDLPTGFKGE